MISVPYWWESLEASLEGYDPGARVTVPDYFADYPGFEEYRQRSPHRILLWREAEEERMVHLGLQARHPIVEVAVTRNDGDGYGDQRQTTKGSPRIVAAWLRAMADELDPPGAPR